ncbi:hypothetical protein P168DRAFT_327575 [Aspergillus campestris IBT 28561]|uniref:F-box domain-containing protein n=1 Tax=Aspergillus campestris (strain IBT 28561) TaxID=1392248 RepID=A0A2I1D0W9_ASPC2|nr:uncharacterized protein P168DRAFT_327575 [Aspergillus campestris IBT 28561]PKY03512.1 hypothetical protein P168DRAFT_327575 [Aspergillus campestris IBT 28561]
MPRGSLESLPPETLIQILELLNYEHPPSLLAVACTSKHCYSLATPLLFRTIKIIYGGPRKLSIDVQGYTEMLSRSAGFRYVRRLLIYSNDGDHDGGHDGDHDGDHDDDWEHDYQWKRPKTSRVERGESEASIFEPHDGRMRWYSDNVQPIRDVNKLNKDWNSLATFLKMLPGLTDLVYECSELLPPCVLGALHHCRPQCRLHVDLSNLPCLYGHPVHSYELELLRSVCLYSIMINFEEDSHHDSDGITSHHADAVQQLVAGVAPNLREVYMFLDHTVGDYAIQNALNFRKELDLKLKGQMLSQRGLVCLQFDNDHAQLTKDWMKYWAVGTDFSSLKILKLWSDVEEEMWKYLIVNHNFSSLHTLLLTMPSAFSPRVSGRYYDTVARFLLSLPPLSSLTLCNWKHDLPLDAVIPYHGPNLRKLSVSPFDDESLTLVNVKRISTSCPLLEELKLPLRRSKGDSTEVMAYQALGSLPSLRSLDLTLNASNRSVLDSGVSSDGEAIIPDNPTFDEFDRAFFTGDQFSRPEMHYHGIPRFPRNGHIRDALINSALDRTLARDIFRAVSSGKKSSSMTLERLSLTVEGGGDLGGDSQLLAGLILMVDHLNRPFTVERNPRDDRRDHLTIRRHKHTNHSGIYSTGAKIDPYEDIFCRIWPVSQHDHEQWWTRWHSFPLVELPTSGSDS